MSNLPQGSEENCDVFRPISGIRPPENSTLTIIFVSALHILYEKKSNDPIFPADAECRDYEENESCYYNSDPRSRPIACIDTTWLCSHDGRACWAMTAPTPPDQNNSAYWLMKYSLTNSNIYDAIKFRLGSALVAQAKVGQDRSLALSDSHWKEEIKQLFATSLARAQFDAWSIASGADRERPGYKNIVEEEFQGNLCGIYKFRTTNSVNVNAFALIGLALVWPGLWLLTFETKDLRKLNPRHWKSKGQTNEHEQQQDEGDTTDTVAHDNSDANIAETALVDAGATQAGVAQANIPTTGNDTGLTQAQQTEQTWEPFILTSILYYIIGIPLIFLASSLKFVYSKLTAHEARFRN